MNSTILSRNAYILVAILVLAAALRFNHINQPYVDAFSWRQTSTAMMADNYYRTNWNIFFPEVSWGGIGPNYQGRELQTVSYSAALLYTVFGQQDWIGRSVAVTFSVWGIFAFYQLVRRVWDEPRALISAAILAIMPGSIFVDRSFLPDPAMTSLMVTSCWLMIAHLQTGGWLYLAVAAVIFCWGALSKITGLMVGLPLLYAIFVILAHKREMHPSRLVPIAIAGSLSLIPVVSYYLWAKYLASNYPPYHFAGSANWIWVNGLGDWLEKGYYLSELWINAYYWLWTLPIMVLALLGFVVPYCNQNVWTQRLETPAFVNVPWFFHWWVLAAALYYGIGARELVENPWNFHVFNPAIAALAGAGTLDSMKAVSVAINRVTPKAALDRLRLQPVAAGLTLIIVLTSILGFGHVYLKSMYSRSWKQESYELGIMLREMSQPGDLVVTMASDLGDPNVIYYSRRRGWTFPPADNDIHWDRFPENDNDSIRMFEDLRQKGADWLAIAAERDQDFWSHHPKLVAHIKSTCEYQTGDQSGIIYRILPDSYSSRG